MGWRCVSDTASKEGHLLEDDPAAPCDPNIVPEESAGDRLRSSGAAKVILELCTLYTCVVSELFQIHVIRLPTTGYINEIFEV
jgi:hypothetical protein